MGAVTSAVTSAVKSRHKKVCCFVMQKIPPEGESRYDLNSSSDAFKQRVRCLAEQEIGHCLGLDADVMGHYAESPTGIIGVHLCEGHIKRGPINLRTARRLPGRALFIGRIAEHQSDGKSPEARGPACSTCSSASSRFLIACFMPSSCAFVGGTFAVLDRSVHRYSHAGAIRRVGFRPLHETGPRFRDTDRAYPPVVPAALLLGSSCFSTMGTIACCACTASGPSTVRSC